MKWQSSLIVAAFALTVAWARGADAPKEAETEERRIPVETTPVTQRVFEERLVVQGNLEAQETAMVPARLSGTLMKLYVAEGDAVKAGKTPLLLIDDLKLRKALELRKLDLAVAHCTVMEKAANLEKEQAALDRAEKDYQRQSRLFNEDKIGTLDAVEDAEAEHKKAVAEVKHAESILALAKEQEHQAKAQVDMAEKDLSDATVLAPIDGVIAKRYLDVGEMGATDKPVFRIENVASIEVSAFLPARYYRTVQPGRTRIQVELEGEKLGEFPVSYRSPTIDSQLRVFEVKCLLPRGIPGAVPGAMVKASVVLRRENGLGVPKKALVKRLGGDVAFVAEDGRAKAVNVETSLEDDGWILVKGDGLAAGVPVVSRGQFLLNDGSAVEIRSPGSATAKAPEPETGGKVVLSVEGAQPKSTKEN
jgi:multidrug efflux pump subunit AcrA (membrane-fusion protein)